MDGEAIFQIKSERMLRFLISHVFMVSYHTPENAIGAAENFSLRRWRRWSPLVCLSSPPSIFSHSQDARSCLHESSRHAASDAKTRDAVVAKVPESMLTTTLNKTASLNLTT